MCIPGLHISLGIFDRLWDLLQQAARFVDGVRVRVSGELTAEAFVAYEKARQELVGQRELKKVQSEHIEVRETSQLTC